MNKETKHNLIEQKAVELLKISKNTIRYVTNKSLRGQLIRTMTELNKLLNEKTVEDK